MHARLGVHRGVEGTERKHRGDPSCMQLSKELAGKCSQRLQYCLSLTPSKSSSLAEPLKAPAALGGRFCKEMEMTAP